MKKPSHLRETARWIKRRLKYRLHRFGPVHRRYLDRTFAVELRLFAGRPPAAGDHPSIAHYSVGKSATRYTRHILMRCSAEAGLIPVDFENLAFAGEHPCPYEMTPATGTDTTPPLFHPRGFLYSVFTRYVPWFPHPDAANPAPLTVLMVRDPRDVLTSLYFSMRHTHALPSRRDRRRAFQARIRAARRLDIDTWILGEYEPFLTSYEEYRAHLLPDPHVLTLTYEQMIGDFSGWLEALLDHCRLPITSSLKTGLIAEAARSRPAVEDVTRHRRQVEPGDHRRKLAPGTISELNHRFHDVLAAFGYLDGTGRDTPPLPG